MRISPMMRGARAYALATLAFSLALLPSYARMGGGGQVAAAPRSAPGFGHSHHFASGEFNRGFEPGRFGFNRFGPRRFDRLGYNRFRFNRFGGNELFVGGWGWGGFPVSTAAPEPIIVGDGAPVIINIGVDPDPDDVGSAYSGGCVIHKLNYDSSGKYVGERQIPQC
jgi:hypothetical protein